MPLKYVVEQAVPAAADETIPGATMSGLTLPSGLTGPWEENDARFSYPTSLLGGGPTETEMVWPVPMDATRFCPIRRGTNPTGILTVPPLVSGLKYAPDTLS